MYNLVFSKIIDDDIDSCYNYYEEITGIRNLINLLEEADKDIENGNYLTKEEMDKKLELL